MQFGRAGDVDPSPFRMSARAGRYGRRGSSGKSVIRGVITFRTGAISLSAAFNSHVYVYPSATLAVRLGDLHVCGHQLHRGDVLERLLGGQRYRRRSNIGPEAKNKTTFCELLLSVFRIRRSRGHEEPR